MSRVEVSPAAAAAVVPGLSSGRAGGDGARFEVAIKAQLDSGRAPQVRDHVHPAAPRSRSVVDERSQRPTPDTVFERPDRPLPADRGPRPERPDRSDHPGHPQRPGHPPRFDRSARDTLSSGAPSSADEGGSTSTPRSADLVAPASQPSSDGVLQPPAASTVPPAAAAGSAAAAAEAAATATADPASGDPTASGTSGADRLRDQVPGQVLPQVPAQVPAQAPGAQAPAAQVEAIALTEGRFPGSAAASTPSTPSAGQDRVTGAVDVPGTADVVGRPAAGQPGAGGAADQPGAERSGAGEPAGTPVPALVHGRPPGLGAAATGSGAVPPEATTAPTAPVATAAPTAVPVALVDTTAAATVVPTAPTPGAAVATPVATAPAAHPVVPLPPQAQVLSALSPLFTAPDGTHRVTVHLEPENLGKVRVQLTLSGGEVAMHLVAADAATREALRQGLPELRAQLEQSGLRTAGMDVQSGSADLFGQAGAGAGAGAEGRPAARAGHGAVPARRGGHDPALTAATPTSRPQSHDVALDVRM